VNSIAAGPDGFVHPANETEITELIHTARRERAHVRVRGGGHSVSDAILATSLEGRGGTHSYDVLLDRMIATDFDPATRRVTVQAGCHLGKDPSDPTGSSTLENSLFKQMHDRGLATPDTGGIIHQAVGGFLSTGSSGGSLVHSIYDAAVGVRLIDGTGQVRELRREDGAESPFFGAVISMGLLGVVTSVTFQCMPSYHVIGTEHAYKVPDSPVDLFASGPNGFEAFARKTQHVRLMWWPQRRVEKLLVWQAHRMRPEDYNDETGPPDAFRPKPYELVEKIFGSAMTSQRLANKVFRTFGRLNPPPPRNGLQRVLDKALAPLYAPVVNAFLPTGEKGAKRFWDHWWKALPMDNEASDELLPTEFTEAWIPIERTAAVMTALRDHFAAHGLAGTGTHATEIYVAKASPFWMSPAYQQDVLRVDIFWFAKNEGRPEIDFYPQHWKLLDQFQPRYHWGKHLPVSPAALRARFPRWDDFLRLRAELDPDGVFLTPYWRERLGV
jgi:FAD/FMN-containing dehydrogenase